MMNSFMATRPYSAQFDEHYWAPGRGVEEKRGVFVVGTRLPALCEALQPNQRIVIGELGFGTGLNCALALETYLALAPLGAELVFYSTEAHPLPLAELQAIHAALPTELASLLAPIRAAWPCLDKGWNTIPLSPAATLHLWVGEALDGLNTLPFTADCWWLDGFSPSKNPAMWAPELLAEVAKHSRIGTRVASYSVARVARDRLQDVGFAVERVEGIPPKRHRLEGILRG
jgi:tRNA 5-methylaminomethyl-2-thiouridine biosynthesis bifunctional protein